MNKKIIAVMLTILLSSTGASIVLAQESASIHPLLPKYSRFPQVRLAQGVAVDKNTLETQPVAFIEMKYGTSTHYYLILGEDVYKMNKTNSKYDWETGTKIFQYESEDGDMMTVVAQRYSNGCVGFSAEFKNYIISFEPYLYYPHLVKTKTKPVKIIKQVEESTGIDIGSILKKPAKPIAEWIS